MRSASVVSTASAACSVWRSGIPSCRSVVANGSSSGGNQPSARFFAELYVGLYYDAIGNRSRAVQHLRNAAAKSYAPAGGYMHRVAELHPLLRTP